MNNSAAFTTTPDTHAPGATTRPRPWRPVAIGLWLLVAIVTAIVYLQPVRSQSIRLELIAGSALLWLGALGLVRSRALRILGVALPALAAATMLLPGRPVDQDRLRDRYIDGLKSYLDTPYIWGGETRRGIDCSGLVRAGLVTAHWREGIATRNPALLRAAMLLAWNDTSARAMQQQHRGQTRLLFEAKSIDSIDDSQLLPGDFAVTPGGIHCLAYIGDGTWIEAEPGDKVITLKRNRKAPWMSSPVSVLRWRHLEGRVE